MRSPEGPPRDENAPEESPGGKDLDGSAIGETDLTAGAESPPADSPPTDEPSAPSRTPESFPLEAEPAGEAEQPSHEGLVRDYFETVLVAVLIVLFLQTFAFQQSKIPSGSMKDTLLVGDHILVNKFVFSPSPLDLPFLPHREPRRGDIVVFHPPTDLEKDYIKRVIGVPGDHIVLRDGVLYRNYVEVDEPWRKLADPHGLGRDHPEIVVPEGHYFLMGDNRDESQDSRFWGPIPRHSIHGRAVLVWFSVRPPAPEDQPPADLSAWERIVWSLQRLLRVPSKARWDRTLEPIR